MKYRDRTTGHIYQSQYEIQMKYSNVSFPTIWTAATYDFVNVDEVVETPQIATHPYNRADYSVELVNGVWTEVWTEVPKYDDPVEQAAWVAEYDAMHQQGILEKYELYVATARTERNKKLLDTDFTQLPDAPITAACKDAFRVYRQSLRDIDFQNPFDIPWPTPPIYEKE